MNTSKARTFRNIIYASLGKGVTLVCIAVTSSVVARNLSPSDYGVVGFAGIIIGFLAHFSDVGVAAGAIRRPTLDRQALLSAFTLKLVLSSAAFVAAWLAAPFAHLFFEHPATTNIIRVLALNFLVGTVGFMSFVTLVREQNYRALVIPGITGTLVRSILAVTLILWGWKYWAVVVADVGATLAVGIVMQFVRKIPLGIRFDRTEAKEYLRFGVPLLGSGVLAFLIFNMDNFLVGSKMGSATLGYYALAFTWGSFICTLLADTVNNVLLPAFSAIQDDTAAMRRWYLKTIDIVGFVAVVCNTALLANTRFFLTTFLGKGTGKWLPAATALEILCVYGILRATVEPAINLIMVRGKTKIMLYAYGMAGALELGLLLLVLRTGKIELVAIVVLVAYLSQVIVYVPFVRREFSVGFVDIFAQLWPVIPALAGGWAITMLLPNWFGDTFLTLACRGVFTATVVALIHGLFTRFRCFQEAGGMISQSLARLRA